MRTRASFSARWSANGRSGRLRATFLAAEQAQLVGERGAAGVVDPPFDAQPIEVDRGEARLPVAVEPLETREALRRLIDG